MQFRSAFFVLISAMIMQSCSSENKKADTTSIQTTDSILPKENFPKGQVIEKVVCKNDSSQSYALYLPSLYSTDKTFPVIFAFDPDSNGNIPVTMYKELAEQFGFIIIGSNNSRNGNSWDETQIIANKLFTDAGSRLSINTQRIYTLGFSGGARIANALTIANGFIDGVICCGAASPGASSYTPRGMYSFLGIIGNEDFNYTEVKKYDLVEIAGHNVKHYVITFDGKHEWPSKEIMNDGFWWLELNNMRKDVSKKNALLIAKKFEPSIQQIKTHIQNKEEYEAYKLLRKTIIFYDGLADLTYCFASFKQLETSREIDKQLKMEEISWKTEEDLKQNYTKAFQMQDYPWWKKDITVLNKKIKTEKNKMDVLIYKRVLAFLSLAAYMQTSGALHQNNIQAAEHFCNIYMLVDPTNSEAHYLNASLNAKKGNVKGALISLNDAIKNGFSDTLRLQNDSAFISLKSMNDFNSIIKRNAQKKD